MEHHDHDQNYNTLGRRWRRKRGFRLSCHRFSVRRLRARILAIFRLVGRCFKSLTTEGSRRGKQRCNRRSTSRRGLVPRDDGGGQREFKSRVSMRSNSFYAEAIADCLDFIKRNSVSSTDDSDGGFTMAGEGEVNEG